MEEPNHPETRMPNEYACRILLAAAGLSPQAVTETVSALSRSKPAFVPT
jgi:hypothetical protein